MVAVDPNLKTPRDIRQHVELSARYIRDYAGDLRRVAGMIEPYAQILEKMGLRVTRPS
jgi:hypothetical protein